MRVTLCLNIRNITQNKTMRFNQFSCEMTLAIIIKFTLFGLVWWLFFAGQKVKVDEEKLTNRLFGSATLNEEKLK